MQTAPMQIDQLLAWGAPRRVDTCNGPRNLRTARATEEFRLLWRLHKDELKAAGISWNIDFKTGELTGLVNWWQEVSAAEEALERATVEASHSLGSDHEWPCPVGYEYYPFQKAGIAYAVNRLGTLIADEMGLGKTVQAIGVLNAEPALRRVLVICPATLKLNWRNEIERWAVHTYTVQIIDGRIGEAPTAEIVIINYDLLSARLQQLQKISWDLIIADEAHRIKNKTAERTRATHALVTRRKLALTGTPLQNRPIELFWILHWLDPLQWPKSKFMDYAKRYCGAWKMTVGKGDYERTFWKMDGCTNAAELQHKLRSTLMVRRLKTEVLKDLPAKQRSIVKLEVTPAELQQLADLTKQHAEREVELQRVRKAAECHDSGGTDRAAYEAAAKKLKDLTQAAFEEMAALRHLTGRIKAPYAIEFLSNALDEGDNKVIVFGWHVDVLNSLAAGLKDYGVAMITGATPPGERMREVAKFQTNPKCRVFIGNYQAAGEGITLTAASHVVFVEVSWVPGQLTQAEDRAHRIGQADSVFVQHLVIDGSLDARMVQMLVDKQNMADRVLDKQ